MMNTQESATEGEHSSSSTAADPAKHSARRRVLGAASVLAVGLTAGVGIGVASGSSQSSVESSRVVPMGAQLPWDDSMSSDNPLANDDSRDGDDSRSGEMSRRERRDQRTGDERDKIEQRMHEGMRDGRGLGAMQRLGIPGPRELMDTVASTLGIEVEDLIREIRSGKSIADIASENDVEIQEVIDALVDEVVDVATDVISDLVNRRMPQS